MEPKQENIWVKSLICLILNIPLIQIPCLSVYVVMVTIYITKIIV